MNITEIKEHLYSDNTDAAINYIRNITDEETLFVYANNYNWDNGFSIPREIIQHKYCTLSIALLLFHLADGITFLTSKFENPNLPEWSSFISELFLKIKDGKYPSGKVAFSPELTKIQMYKLKKELPDDEMIFIQDIDGEDCNILL